MSRGCKWGTSVVSKQLKKCHLVSKLLGKIDWSVNSEKADYSQLMMTVLENAELITKTTSRVQDQSLSGRSRLYERSQQNCQPGQSELEFAILSQKHCYLF